MKKDNVYRNIQVLQEELRLRGFKLKQDEVREVYNAFCDMIRDYARNGYDLNFPNIGKFIVKTYPAREQASNLTGEIMVIPEKKRLKFKPSKKLTDLLNRNMPE